MQRTENGKVPKEGRISTRNPWSSASASDGSHPFPTSQVSHNRSGSLGDVLLRSVLPLEVNTFGLVSQCCSVSGVGGGPWLSGPSSALNAGKLSLGTRGSQLPRGGVSPPSVLGSSGFISSNLRVCSVLEQPQSLALVKGDVISFVALNLVAWITLACMKGVAVTPDLLSEDL